jgi:hypothetical protein
MGVGLGLLGAGVGAGAGLFLSSMGIADVGTCATIGAGVGAAVGISATVLECLPSTQEDSRTGELHTTENGTLFHVQDNRKLRRYNALMDCSDGLVPSRDDFEEADRLYMAKDRSVSLGMHQDAASFSGAPRDSRQWWNGYFDAESVG